MQTWRGGCGSDVAGGCAGAVVAGGCEGVVVGWVTGVWAVEVGDGVTGACVVTDWVIGCRDAAVFGAAVRGTTGTERVPDGGVVAAGCGGAGVPAVVRGAGAEGMVAEVAAEVVASGSVSPTGRSGVAAAAERPSEPPVDVAAIVRPPPARATAVAAAALRRFLRQRACCWRRAARPPGRGPDGTKSTAGSGSGPCAPDDSSSGSASGSGGSGINCADGIADIGSPP
ncbi:conserved hypothetical protein [Actinacidiphila bryophytorum]|uniref:Uncharacterized protein n=1 Tax=Actinacidiphila bryophytorum TaxID=1436133 RepID=A0A9W4EC58_9ACTN|nr:conserved hypothetical protein [Actinacidiphila bryophytorum]